MARFSMSGFDLGIVPIAYHRKESVRGEACSDLELSMRYTTEYIGCD